MKKHLQLTCLALVLAGIPAESYAADYTAGSYAELSAIFNTASNGTNTITLTGDIMNQLLNSATSNSPVDIMFSTNFQISSAMPGQKNLTIRGNSIDVAIGDVNHAHDDHLNTNTTNRSFYIYQSRLNLDTLTVTNNYTSSLMQTKAGAIYNDGGILYATNVIFRENHLYGDGAENQTASGGTLFNANAGEATPTLGQGAYASFSNSTFHGNFINRTFQGDQVLMNNVEGGGIHNDIYCTLNIDQTRFSWNIVRIGEATLGTTIARGGSHSQYGVL